MKDILFLAHRAPTAPDRGDRIRSYHVLRHLARRARVHLLAFNEEPVAADAFAGLAATATVIERRLSRPRALARAMASGRPVSLVAFDDPAMHAAVAAAPRHDAIYCFSGQMAQYLPPGVPAVMDFVDVDSAKFDQQARSARWPMARVYAREATLLGAHERAVAGRVQASLFVTAAEAALFRARGGTGRIIAVENGIDAGCFSTAAPFAILPDGGPLIVFTGQMDYAPNVEAVRWFAQSVLPAVRQRHPAARFAIVGRAPTAAVQALARQAGVLVTGEVADVRPWLAAATVCVAPLQLARGVQNKVLEAMAMARPVIASPAAADGIDHCGTIAVATGSRGWTDAVSAVLANPADPIGAQARALVLRRYDWDAQLAPLDALLGLTAVTRAAA